MDNSEVFVYYNFNKKCWSIKQKGKVVAYADSVLLKDCTFKVSQAGRKRVLKEKRKNVHAGVLGTLIALDVKKRKYKTAVDYNPYKQAHFKEVVSRKNVSFAKEAYLVNGKVWI